MYARYLISGNPCPQCDCPWWIEGRIASTVTVRFKPGTWTSFVWSGNTAAVDAYACRHCGFVLLYADPGELLALMDDDER